MDFEVLGPIRDIETIAAGAAIRDLRRLRRQHGAGRWRKRKAVARVRLHDGTIHGVEVHWYEAHRIGRREMKTKFPLLGSGGLRVRGGSLRPDPGSGGTREGPPEGGLLRGGLTGARIEECARSVMESRPDVFPFSGSPQG